jgi:hypothetical protein
MSTSLPFPSSPHCVPRTTTTWAVGRSTPGAGTANVFTRLLAPWLGAERRGDGPGRAAGKTGRWLAAAARIGAAKQGRPAADGRAAVDPGTRTLCVIIIVVGLMRCARSGVPRRRWAEKN